MSDNIGANIKKLRVIRDWTQKELADRVNVSKQVISNWERGYTKPDDDDIVNLCRVFDVSADTLLFGRYGKRKDPSVDLARVLREGDLMFNGVPLTEAEKIQVKKVIEALFWEAMQDED